MQINNYTQISNEFIDNMNKYSGSEVKLFLAISRKTIGWHKLSDRISYSQLRKITGLSTNSLKKSIKILVDDNWILQSETINGYEYDLNIDNEVSKNDTIENELYQKLTPPVSKNDTVKPETVSKIDTTKDNNINILTKEKKGGVSIKDNTLYKELKEIYNNFLLSNNYSQEEINTYIFKELKELKQHNNFLKKFKSKNELYHFLNIAKLNKWIMECPLPTRLISQYNTIRATKNNYANDAPPAMTEAQRLAELKKFDAIIQGA